MDAAAAARRFVDGWTEAWFARDPDAVAELYADGAVFVSHPFREPQAPRDYAEWAFAEDEPLAELRWGEPILAGDRAAVEYWALMGDSTLAGVALIRFRSDGFVVEQRDYWAVENRRREPPASWGR
jgi:hypothetical protein